MYNITLDVISIVFGLVLDGTWCNGRRNALMGNNPEKVSNVQKTTPKSNNQDKERKVEKLCRHDNSAL